MVSLDEGAIIKLKAWTWKNLAITGVILSESTYLKDLVLKFGVDGALSLLHHSRSSYTHFCANSRWWSSVGRKTWPRSNCKSCLESQRIMLPLMSSSLFLNSLLSCSQVDLIFLRISRASEIVIVPLIFQRCLKLQNDAVSS